MWHTIRWKCNQVNIFSNSLRVARVALVLLLAVLVAYLGAAAKHSQFEGSPQHGYLAKSVKMAGARLDPGSHLQQAHALDSPALREPVSSAEPTVFPAVNPSRLTSASVLARPLRV